MGLLDSVAGALLNHVLGGSQQNALTSAVFNMLGNNSQLGGLNGLLGMLKQKGLGEQAASWVSTGQNMAVSGDQVQGALGGDFIQQLASQIGASPQQASSGLAALLPHIIDKLTPDGQVPQSNLMDQGLALLKSKLLG